MKTIIHMLITLTIIGVVSGGVLSQLSAWAEPKIEHHRREATKLAIFNVQPEAKKYEKLENIEFEAYKVFDEAGTELGYALPYEGNGFSGKIRLMVGITPDFSKIIGLRVLEQVETPGLGTKIVNDPSNKENEFWFRDQFAKLNCLPGITVVKNQKPSKDSEIQAITGATISSKAVVELINLGVKDLQKAVEGGK